VTVARGKWDVNVGASARARAARPWRCITSGDARAYMILAYLAAAAVLAHLASVFRNGYAFDGGSIVPVSEVLKGTMRP